MRENYKTWISFCFIVLTITLFSSIIPKSIATSNLSQNSNNSINESEGQGLISSNNTKLKIFASFYPIYDFVKKIGKDRVDVSTIVPASIEPHDFEPTAKQVIELQKADVIFINGAGFESWINKIGDAAVVDLSKDLPIENLGFTPNPHIWLDPNLVKAYSKTIFEKLISLDPQNTDYYTNNFNEFNSKLELLNSDIKMNLTNCDLNDFIAFHDAFGYFAKRYGLTQHSISGSSPEADVNPQRIAECNKIS